MAGISAAEFDPNADITKRTNGSDFVQIRKLQEDRYTKWEITTNILSYDDYNDISEYAIPSMQWAAGSGLMVGKTDTTLNPKRQCHKSRGGSGIYAICRKF